MVAVPAETPVTTPVDPTEAVPVALLLHVPPGVPSVKEMELPTHTALPPPIAAGSGFTVIVLVLKHPAPEE